MTNFFQKLNKLLAKKKRSFLLCKVDVLANIASRNWIKKIIKPQKSDCVIKCLQLASFTWEMAFIKIMVVSSKDNRSHPPIPYYCWKVHETSFPWQLMGLSLRTIMSALIRHSLGFRSPPDVAMTSNIVYVGETQVWSCNEKQSRVCGGGETWVCDPGGNYDKPQQHHNPGYLPHQN